MRAGATSSIKRTLKQEQIRLKLLGIAKPNWKRENRRLCGRQQLRTSLRQILRDEIAGWGRAPVAEGRSQRDRHAYDLAYIGAPPKYSFSRHFENGPPVLCDHFDPCQLIHHREVNSAET